jgi:hypothetical protein
MPDGKIYLGMRHEVAVVEKKAGSHKTSWLLPNTAFADAKVPDEFR